MTTTEIRKVVTVPRGLNAHTEAIEKSGLVNITSTGITAVTGLTYTYAIFGDDPADETGMMTLTIELDAKEFNAVQAALGQAAGAILFTSDTDRLELMHLRTLLAEAAAPDRKATA